MCESHMGRITAPRSRGGARVRITGLLISADLKHCLLIMVRVMVDSGIIAKLFVGSWRGSLDVK